MTWSYSRVASFAECPYRWFLSYLYRDENGKPLKKKSGFFAEFGTYMHGILQMYFNGLLASDDLSTYYVAHFKENVVSIAPNHKIYMNYFEQGFHYLDEFSFPHRNVLGVEEKVDFEFAGRPFTGFIDLRNSDGGKLIITDHKSRALKPRSKRSKPTKQDAELDEYLRQLYVYSAAVKSQYGQFPDALEFNCFRTQTMIQEPFEIKRFYQVEKWVGEQIDSIVTNNKWSADTDYWRCNYLCDVCDHCEYKGLI